MAGYLGSVPVPQATQHRETFTATAGQTTFNTAGYTPQFIDVYLNGVHLSPADVTATNGSDVVLSACLVNDIVDVVSYTPFEVASQTFTGTTTMTDVVAATLDISGNIDIDGTTNLDVVDIDGAVDMASTLTLAGNADFNGDLDVDGTTNLDVVDIDGAVNMATTLLVTGVLTNTGNISITETGANNEKSLTIANSSANSMIGVEGSSGNRFVGSAANNMFMGTTSADGLEFATNNTVRANIASDGTTSFNSNVGIGTSAPVADFVVSNGGAAGIELQPEIATDTNRITNFDRAASAYMNFRLDALTHQFLISGTEVMRIASNGDVGIGKSSPGNPGWARNVHFHGSGNGGGLKLTDNTSGSGNNDGLDIASYQGTAFIINRENADIRFHTNDAEKMRITSSGAIGFNNSSPSHQFDFLHDSAATYMARFHHNGNNVNRYGIIIAVGTDDNSGTNTHISFADGDSDSVGSVSSSGGTVSYNAFSASHEVILPDADNAEGYPYGTLVETSSITYAKNLSGQDFERGIRYNVTKSSGANSKAVLGAYSGKITQETNLHFAYVLGDGHILCNNSGGNIAVGDGICTSSTAGIGQKATVNPSMIIGIAQEAITFADNTETKLVAVQYGLQQFTPWP